jgi:aspartate-semialdehyde dehydrogenase
MKTAVVGVTGLVGQKMLQVLQERKFPVEELIPVASERSAGGTVSFRGIDHTIQTLPDALEEAPDLALFSAGRAIAEEWAKPFTEKGTVVIDNSSAWRMDANVPLIVPEVNGDLLQSDHSLIANPNCSTIQLMVALQPLQQKYGIERLVISTYQSVTGSGADAVRQLENERAGQNGERTYPHPIDRNCLPQCDDFQDNDYTKEEMKLINESRKIFNRPDLRITATAVRVPVDGGHSESVNVALKKEFDLRGVRSLIADSPGLILQDDPATNAYPMPIDAHEKDDVFVGRLRRDESNPKTLNFWVVADNLRKGAATNAVQIAELVFKREFQFQR